MAAQAALIADTIVGMKRALRREHDYAPDEPITQPTNRGNKLRANAKYVREGAMGYINAEEIYKQKIEHAGYTRYILQPNPVRYDSEGDELDDDDEDSEADIAAADENPFSEIALEHLLCPIKHPSELPHHPSMSHAYTSKALRNMTQAIETKLRQERALLWRAKNLHRQFLGDGSWMPCGAVETPEDKWIFEPRMPEDRNPQAEQSKAATPAAANAQNGAEASAAASVQGSQAHQAQDKEQETDVDMTDAQNESTENKEPKAEEVDASVRDLPQHAETNSDQVNGDKADTQMKEGESTEPTKNNVTDKPTDADQSDTQEETADAEMQDGSSPEPPRRMTTRAQANAAENDSTGAHSPSPSTSTFDAIPTPHPLFLVPDSVRPDANFGLPPNEAEDTRRLLWSYVQKQEETVRGFEHMLDRLLRACRMKEDVFEWCKAEGHVGEMSDGEDWYDREKWGLAEGEDLKKGADEDEVEPVDESRATGKRGRGRRA